MAYGPTTFDSKHNKHNKGDFLCKIVSNTRTASVRQCIVYLQYFRVSSIRESYDNVWKIPPIGARSGGDMTHARCSESTHLFANVISKNGVITRTNLKREKCCKCNLA